MQEQLPRWLGHTTSALIKTLWIRTKFQHQRSTDPNTVEVSLYADFSYTRFIVHAIEDVDQDGRDELLIEMYSPPSSYGPSNPSSKAFALFKPNGDNGYTVISLHIDGETKPSNAYSYSGGAIIDWDNDNDLDIVLLSYPNQ